MVRTGAVQDILRFRWKLGQSEITQDMILHHHNPRIDFQTHVSWNEAHKLLKVGFPIDVVTDKATYEIPFGALERPTHRNTSWEQAQYEVCGHRFADVSERGYGVSLLNDCKYGYDIQGSTIRLSLLRAPKWPDATADLGEHDFTYSLYPHRGDWREAHTVRRAAELNHELYTFAASSTQGSCRQQAHLLDSPVNMWCWIRLSHPRTGRGLFSVSTNPREAVSRFSSNGSIQFRASTCPMLWKSSWN